MLHYIERKTKNRTGVIVKIVIKCCMCCLWCLEKCLRFINKNAYIEIAIYGYNFCTAARRAFFTILKNILRVGVLNLVTAFLLFVMRLLVVAATGCIAYYWIKNDTELRENLHFWGLLVFFICIISYFIAKLVLDIYDMAVDSIFLCYAEDAAHNGALVSGGPKLVFFLSNLRTDPLNFRFCPAPAGQEAVHLARPEEVYGRDLQKPSP